MNEGFPSAAPVDGVDAGDRVAAMTRLRDLFSTGELSLENFYELLERVLAVSGSADLEEALSMLLPSPVRLTPTERRLTKPLILHAPDGGLELGPGWQLAAHTTISTGFGATRLDLTSASWDSRQIDLCLETWGSIEVLVPKGVAVQMTGGSGVVYLGSLCEPATGGPVLRVSTSGPTGVIRINHPKARNDALFTRWARRRARSGSSPNG